jgi:diguanylate cyclase (GGDEF)-like protein
VLGWRADDLVGTSMLAHLAPESVEHAVQSLAAASDYVQERSATGAASASWDGLGPVVRLKRPDGTTVSCSVAVATPVRTGLPGYVLQLRRSDAAYALESALIAMGEGRSLPEVMAEVASMLEGELPAADVSVFCRQPDGALHHVVGPPALGSLLAATAELAATPWASTFADPGGVVEHEVEALPSPIRGIAVASGYRSLALHVRPGNEGGPTPALLAIWSAHPFPMHVFTHERVLRCGSLVAMVQQWERGQQALQWEATHDVLTGLHNRSFFHGALDRLEGDDPAVVLYLDLDDFKPVNDEHGHGVGDDVLVEVAARLHRAVRPGDLVARLGGDEFAVLCPDLTDAAAAERLAGRLVDEVAKPMVVDGHAVHVGLSVGLACVHAGSGAADVLERADAALRRAKVDGKRRWRRASDAGLVDAEPASAR